MEHPTAITGSNPIDPDKSFYERYPRDLRPRTPRSDQAQEIGEKILAYLAQRRNVLRHVYDKKGDLPILFGTETGGFDRNRTPGSPPYEMDPRLHGFIALVDISLFGEDYLNFLRETLEVSDQIPSSAGAYSHLPVRPWAGPAVFRRTNLTDTDGLVWFEIGDATTKGPPSSQRLMIFPPEKLRPASTTS